ncbi:tyrosine-type recombinase/integrase [Rhizobium mongolense]|uniref:tyrosine-type recombinase/integrase n=1 Tax=Rhizobium mongolense TaxID=57676 RepID=UPI0034A47876
MPEASGATRELTLFNLAIDSKLRACDLVRLRVEHLWSGSSIRDRATIIQKRTKRPVQFEATEQTKIALVAWLPFVRRNGGGYLFPSRPKTSQHLSTRQYARIVHRWVACIGLDTSGYGTHSMRRTKAAQIYRKTGNLRAVQILLGTRSSKEPSDTSAFEVDVALRIAEQIELYSTDHRREPRRTEGTGY